MLYYQSLSVDKNTVTIPLKKKYRHLSTTTHFTQVKNTTKDRNYFLNYLLSSMALNFSLEKHKTLI
jgi:hypothetical protein